MNISSKGRLFECYGNLNKTSCFSHLLILVGWIHCVLFHRSSTFEDSAASNGGICGLANPSRHLCHCSIDVDLWSAVNFLLKKTAVTSNKQFVSLDSLRTYQLPSCQAAKKNTKKKKDADKRTGDVLFLTWPRCLWRVRTGHRHLQFSQFSHRTAPVSRT